MAPTVQHDKKYQQFSIFVDSEDDDAELAYATPSPDVIDFTHTYVPEAVRGTGLVQQLIEAGLAYAQKHRLKIKASCPAVQKYLQQHPEYEYLLQR